MPRSITRAQARAYDQSAIAGGIPGSVLMENAARGCVELLESLGIDGLVGIVCGKGNNAGDGFVMARLLKQKGHAVHIELIGSPADLKGDAAWAYDSMQGIDVPVHEFDDATIDRLRTCDWVVDALLGTGAQGTVRPPFDRAIDKINAARRKTFAVDLPSGLDADDGLPLGPVVRAQHTATFVARKVGFDNPASKPYTGEVHVLSIGGPELPD